MYTESMTQIICLIKVALAVIRNKEFDFGAKLYRMNRNLIPALAKNRFRSCNYRQRMTCHLFCLVKLCEIFQNIEATVFHCKTFWIYLVISEQPQVLNDVLRISTRCFSNASWAPEEQHSGRGKNFEQKCLRSRPCFFK